MYTKEINSSVNLVFEASVNDLYLLCILVNDVSIFISFFFCWNKLAYNRTKCRNREIYPRYTFGRHVKKLVIYEYFTQYTRSATINICLFLDIREKAWYWTTLKRLQAVILVCSFLTERYNPPPHALFRFLSVKSVRPDIHLEAYFNHIYELWFVRFLTIFSCCCDDPLRLISSKHSSPQNNSKNTRRKSLVQTAIL